VIIHLDADAFFASVEQAADPRLRGKPVAVGGSKRGIVASASYEARKLGVYTPMPTARALKICPKLVVVAGDYEKYERFSQWMFTYAYDYTPDVEVQGIDEGYFDVTANRKSSAGEIAATIRRAVFQGLKITVSEGVGSNKLISQVASKWKKPDNLIEVPAGKEREFLAPLPNLWLPGVGPKGSQTLNSAGLASIGQIALATPDQLSLIVGSGAPQLWKFAQGLDERPVIREAPAAKTYGHQETFSQDTTDEMFILAKLRSLTDQLMKQVREDKKMIRTISVRVRYNDMEEETRSLSIQEPTSFESDLYSPLKVLLKKAWTRRVSLRLVAVKVSNVYDALFESELHLDHSLDRGRKLDLAAAVDELKDRFGSGIIIRGHDLWLQLQHKASRSTVKRVNRLNRVLTTPPTRKITAFLNVKSYYSFLDSLLSPEEAVTLAKKHGARVVALTDPNLHAAIPFYQAAKEVGLQPVIAAELRPKSGRRFNAYVKDAGGYTNLCKLLSLGSISEHDLAERSEGLFIIPIEKCGPEIRYSTIQDRHLYNIVQSMRTLTLLNDPHPDKRTGSFHFRNEYAEIDLSEIVDKCRFEFELGGLKFPIFQPTNGSTPHAFLRQLTMEGATRCYGNGRHAILPQLEEELNIITEVGYEDYFLLTWELLQECQAKGISWITRGSAADSLVCYCLGISGVCPVRFELYFQRFLNRDRMALKKLPDIDIDFPHDRRDEVAEMLLAKYGDRAAIVGGFNTFQGRSAVADIAKVLGVAESQIRRLTQRFPRTSAVRVAEAIQGNVECQDLALEEDPYRTAIGMAHRLDGFPRHPKMHPCGIVLSRQPIHYMTPTFISTKGWPTAHFDMDAIEAVGLVKMDILAQAGLSVMRDTVAILKSQGVKVDLERLEPWEDPGIWKMIAEGHSRGVHHIESPAMLTLAKMCGANNIDDLVAIVSVIRPGAANSCKKTKFANRCQGLEPPEYAHPSLEPVLRSTYGVVAYEEHILQICETFAGMGAGRGDILRRGLVKQKASIIEEMRKEFVNLARSKGRTEAEIQTVWNLLAQFQGYAFCRAHSTAYGVEAYQAAHLKLYHAKEFMACVMDHGKGFYNKLVYSIECRRLGYEFLLPNVNSQHEHFFPEKAGIRVPLKQIKGLTTKKLDLISSERTRAPFESVEDFVLRIQPSHDEMQGLIRVGAFDELSPSRTAQFWAWRKVAQWPQEKGQGLLFGATKASPQDAPLNRIEPSHLQRLTAETELMDFPVTGHPLELYPEVAWKTYCPISRLAEFCDKKVTVCGLIIEDRVHHQVDGRPMKFVSLCDWTGIIEAEIFADTYLRCGINTIRYPVVEVDAVVRPYDNKKGHSLDVLGIFKPRSAEVVR